jgi:hypothetical protein
MKHGLNENEMRIYFKNMISHASADYSQIQFERLLIEQSIDQIASSQVKQNWFTSVSQVLLNRKDKKIIFISEILIVLGFILYLNSPPLQEDLTACDLIGEFSLETI